MPAEFKSHQRAGRVGDPPDDRTTPALKRNFAVRRDVASEMVGVMQDTTKLHVVTARAQGPSENQVMSEPATADVLRRIAQQQRELRDDIAFLTNRVRLCFMAAAWALVLSVAQALGRLLGWLT